MARADSVGMFWDDTPPPKAEKKIKEKKQAPEPFWLKEDYLPYLKEAREFNIPLLSDEEIITACMRHEQFVFDIECYSNYFLVAFRNLSNKKVTYFEKTEDKELDYNKLSYFLKNIQVLSFNGNNYDVPLLSLAFSGLSTEELKLCSDEIVLSGGSPYFLLKRYKVKPLILDHIDLIEVAPGKSSLKIYSGRLHVHKMQDLPFHPDTVLNKDQIDIVRLYCCNDLDSTDLLYRSLEKEIELRVKLSNEYKLDLRSKSDAQIAEAVIREEFERLSGDRITVPNIPEGTTYRYNTPKYISYLHPQLQHALQIIQNTEFIVNDKGKIGLPQEIKGLKLEIGNSVYRFGIGGLHSSEKSAMHYQDGNYKIYDFDVTSYYPFIILNLGLFPHHLSKLFLSVYKGIVDRRVMAKQQHNKTAADMLKIVVNGTFGKLGSKYSIIYSPDLMIQVTLTGQLSLLLLIDRLESVDIHVVSANTDGIVVKPHVSKLDKLKEIIEWWQEITGFNLERTEYKALVSRDVNNYIAIKTNNDTKVKGTYATEDIKKNPVNTICVDAVKNYLTEGVPIEETIRNCRDIKKFLTVRAVKGGAVKDKNYLGKSIRWYYAVGVEGDIVYALNGNKVPNSDGAKPLMELPNEFPDDVNYDKYIQESISILRDIGVQ